jgi:hypothetical protein
MKSNSCNPNRSEADGLRASNRGQFQRWLTEIRGKVVVYQFPPEDFLAKYVPSNTPYHKRPRHTFDGVPLDLKETDMYGPLVSDDGSRF